MLVSSSVKYWCAVCKLGLCFLPFDAAELSSCATVLELTRTKQGPFTLEEHILYEDKWTIDEVARSLECCMPLLQEEPPCKKLKMELSEECAMNSEDK